MLTFINTHPLRMNCNQSQRWIESLIGERPTNSKKEFPVPEGEGQGEGNECLMTKLGTESRQTAEIIFNC
jgi:hypothetical protein